jgi:hypothetical protein
MPEDQEELPPDAGKRARVDGDGSVHGSGSQAGGGGTPPNGGEDYDDDAGGGEAPPTGTGSPA